MSEAPFTQTGLDALAPAAVARKAETVGATKAGMPAFDLFVLSVLAGAFIALGAIFATTVDCGRSGSARTAFSGCSPVPCSRSASSSWSSRARSSSPGTTSSSWPGRAGGSAPSRLLGNWGIVWIGNFVGAFATALILFVSKQYDLRRRSGRPVDRSRSASRRRASASGRRSRSGCSATRSSVSRSG